jgi:hypothetical protein
MMTRAQGWLTAFAISALIWVGILWGVSAIARAFSADAPVCRASVCEFYGPGGVIHEWRLAAQSAALAGKALVVPAGKVCGSACVIALGGVMVAPWNANVRISPSARIVWGHDPKLLAKWPMPDWFRQRALL